jgi:hypothetical protein
MFVIRWFICSCAFAGAGWFGAWVYEATRSGGWDSAFTWIIATALIGGFMAAAFGTWASRARR